MKEPWKQDWRYGYTPKCCACKYYTDPELGEKRPEWIHDDWGWCHRVNDRGYVVGEKWKKLGKHPVRRMQGSCFRYEYREPNMLDMEEQDAEI